jgi:23S rRNA (pseudouridine1915-N3)-methyltransferase
MRHHLLFLGRVKGSWIQKGIDDYTQRLQHYTRLETVTLKDPAGGRSGASARKIQGEALLKAVPAGVLTLVLDARGRQFSSEEFAEQFTRWENSGVKGVAWLIGGPEGHSQAVLDAAAMTLSFSKMTFTHDMVRLFLVEQLYRAHTIKAGEKYHK